ncbi:hypothetical protein GCM10023168_25780 [Fodinibacter luteus]|uniref:Guanylate cyclase domain-containing protein n=1 Tax=Fodinibacter luteus TaxID=552064 RepID=A0ABP8KK77_9MICO
MAERAEHVEGGARRLVSVLFADLTGFTALSDRLDAEDVATIQQAYFRRARHAIEERGGTVEKFIGDAVVGTFGLPHGRDDDSWRAVGAGLAVIEGVQNVADELGLAADVLAVRVGVDTGEVHVTFAADGTWQLTGNAMNVAARLQAAAEPGTVLVGAGTALAAEAAYVLQPRGGLSLKGKAEPVPAWQVQAPRDTPSRTWALAGLTAPTIGRDHEIAQLLESLSAATRPAAGWLVNAPPGAGKTRLLDELESRALAAGYPVWRSNVGDGLDRGFAVIARLVRAALDQNPGRGTTHERLLDRLRDRGLTGRRAEVAVDHTVALLDDTATEAEPQERYTSWIAVLDALTPTDRRVLWLVEDVHDCIADVRDFLGTALHAPSAVNRLVVATCRPSLIAGADADPLPGAQLLQLAPLDPARVRDLIDALVGRGVVPDAVAGAVAASARGNPLFVEELLRTWVQADVLRRAGDGHWHLTGGQDMTLPSTVHGVYQSQLDELSDAARRVATSGSIPGRSFPAGALPVLGIDQPGGGLGELGSLGLLFGPHDGFGSPDAYTYRHALLRDVAYATLPRRVRAGLHLRFARWMAATAEPPLVDELVGTHLAAAHASLPVFASDRDGIDRDDVAEEAARRLAQAAEGHLRGEPHRAAQLLDQALSLQPASRAHAVTTAQRQVRRGEALRRAGMLDEAMRAFAAASAELEGDVVDDLEEAASSQRGEVLVAAALGYEDALLASRLPRDTWGPDGLALLDRAESSVPSDDVATRSRLSAARGRAHAYGGDLANGSAGLAQAISLARLGDDPGALAAALVAERAVLTEPHHLRARLDGSAEAVHAARRSGDAELLIEAVRMRYLDLLAAGRMAEAGAARRDAETAITDLGRPLYLWYPAMWRAMEALRTGDPAAAQLIEQFRIEGTRWGYQDAGLVHLVQAVALGVDHGTVAQVLAVHEPVLLPMAERFAVVLAYAHMAAGDAEKARRHLHRPASDGFESLPRDLSLLYNLAYAAEAAAVLRQREASRRLAELLTPSAAQTIVLGSGALCLGSAAHFAGVAHAAAGHTDTAVELLRRAVSANDEQGSGPAAARSRAVLEAVRSGRPVPRPAPWSTSAAVAPDRSRARLSGDDTLEEGRAGA